MISLGFMHKIRHSTATSKQLACEGSGQTQPRSGARNGRPVVAAKNLLPPAALITISPDCHPSLPHVASHLPSAGAPGSIWWEERRYARPYFSPATTRQPAEPGRSPLPSPRPRPLTPPPHHASHLCPRGPARTFSLPELSLGLPSS